jgi:hypothetical protein
MSFIQSPRNPSFSFMVSPHAVTHKLNHHSTSRQKAESHKPLQRSCSSLASTLPRCCTAACMASWLCPCPAILATWPPPATATPPARSEIQARRPGECGCPCCPCWRPCVQARRPGECGRPYCPCRLLSSHWEPLPILAVMMFLFFAAQQSKFV